MMIFLEKFFERIDADRFLSRLSQLNARKPHFLYVTQSF